MSSTPHFAGSQQPGEGYVSGSILCLLLNPLMPTPYLYSMEGQSGQKELFLIMINHFLILINHFLILINIS